MGSGTGKGRVTPFLTCPRSTRAPDKIVSPTRRTPSKTRASAQFRESLALLGVHPLFPRSPGQGGSGVPGLRSPPPPEPRRRPSPLRWELVALARHSARDPGCAWTARPALRRLSWTPKRAANCPLPHRRDGVRPPTCRPLPSRVRPSGSRGRRIRSELVKGEERDQGGSASPSPGTGGGRGRRPLLAAPAPRFPERRAEITPSPRGSDLGTWAGLQPSAPRPRPLSRLPARIRTLHPKQSSETRTRRWESCGRRPGWGGRRGLHLSAPASGREEGSVRISTRSLPP